MYAVCEYASNLFFELQCKNYDIDLLLIKKTTDQIVCVNRQKRIYNTKTNRQYIVTGLYTWKINVAVW